MMGNATVAEELPGAEELDELYQLDASEPAPEDDDENDDENEDEDQDDEDDGGGFKPGEIPHP
jgi:hypothetical protein